MIAESGQQQNMQVRLISIADRLHDRLKNIERQFQTFVEESHSELEALGLSLILF